MLQYEGKVRIPSGCAISGMINKKGQLFPGNDIVKSIALMHERSNGLGGGFAAYGIYPEYKDLYAIHMFYDHNGAKETVELFLNRHFNIKLSEKIPTRKVSSIKDAPIIWRYFALPREDKLIESGLDENEFVVRCVMQINANFEGAFVVSSGKNMGAFKAVGFPEDVGDFYMLDTYKAYIWTAHGRFPTNTPGWWGGAHPFTLLDWSVVHNGEISSYDANKRWLKMYGYKCTLQTDTEVITYMFDLLYRKHRLPLEIALTAMAAPLWDEIERMDRKKRELMKSIRAVYGSALINGPFSIILGSKNGIVALNDRIKLRSLVAAVKDDFVYIASEESAIRVICPKPDRVWAPMGGEPVIALLEGVESI
ncbi:MAG: glutamine amidotransferase family protein [Clostridiales bacterium]|nr:glutamine amidotransferase family protein [Clostridiales bacterium]